MSKDSFKAILHEHYIELVKLQKEVIRSGKKILIILEGRDAAGKDGTIKTLTKHLSPRDTRVVALGKPNDRESKAWYFQRYSEQLPVSGEIVIFNRSWYNRLGVEKVMGFCTDEEYAQFFQEVRLFEELLSLASITLMKYYLDISKQEQKKRLKDRESDPLKQWKLSPIDHEATKLWDDYTAARDNMLRQTNFNFSPWRVLKAEDKDEAHLALLADILSRLNYTGKTQETLMNAGQLVHEVNPSLFKEFLYR